MANPREPIEHAFNMKKLNVFFAIGSVLTFIIFVAAVFYDHEREWKRVQADWFHLERERTQAAIDEAEAKVDKEALQAVEANLEAAETEIARHEKDLVQLTERMKQIDARLYRADQDVRFEKALIASDNYEYETELAAGASGAEKLGKRLAKRKQRYEDLSLALQDVQAEQEAAQAELDRITGKRDAAIKARDQLFADRDRNVRKLSGIASNFVNDWFRDQPLVDFIAPMYKVKQVVVEGLDNEINFLTIPRVDRCQTCHLGIDKVGYDDVEAPFASHPRLDLFVGASSPHPVDQFGCTICHMGRDRGTTMVSTAHTPSDEEEAHRWHEEYDWHEMHFWDYPMLASKYTEASCAICHYDEVSVPEAEKLNYGTFLVENYGCTGCHKIGNREGLPRVAPSLLGLAGKTTPEWTFRWVKKPKAFRPTTKMPQIFDLPNTSEPYDLARSNVETHAIVSYLFAESDPAELDPLPRGMKGDAGRGEELVRNVGCRGCHLMDGEEYDPQQRYRRFGPALTGLGTKSTAEWIYNWVRDPKRIMPTTRMPNLRLTSQEALDITTYLIGLTNPEFEATPYPALDDTLRDAVLLEYLEVTLPDREAREKLGMMGSEEKNRALGEKIIARQGCYGCHLIEGFEQTQRIGTELTEEGSKNIHRFDFGFVDIPHTRPDWIYTKLTQPRVFDEGKIKAPQEKLRMPYFGFTEEEAEAITLAVLSLQKRNIVAERARELKGPEVAAQQGWRTVRNRNCRGCHQIDGHGGDYLKLVEDPGLAPPILAGQGDRVQADWLFEFLKEPKAIRPWLTMRMPTFGFSDEEASDLVRFFQATAPKGAGYEEVDPHALSPESVKTGKQIFNDYRCLSCHQLAAASEKDPADLAPDLALAPSRLRPGWIADWLRDPQQIMPNTRMPSFFYSEGEPLYDDADDQIVALRDYVLTLGKKK